MNATTLSSWPRPNGASYLRISPGEWTHQRAQAAGALGKANHVSGFYPSGGGSSYLWTTYSFGSEGGVLKVIYGNANIVRLETWFKRIRHAQTVTHHRQLAYIQRDGDDHREKSKGKSSVSAGSGGNLSPYESGAFEWIIVRIRTRSPVVKDSLTLLQCVRFKRMLHSTNHEHGVISAFRINH